MKMAVLVRMVFISVLAATMPAFAERCGQWSREKAWQWYDAQPWIRGCNYMPASAANRLDMWQEYGSDARFEEMDRELALAESIGFNTVRVLLEENGFGAWYYEHDDFMKNFERFLALCAKHGIRAIVALGNDCSRPRQLWSIPKPGPQTFDWGYHGGRKLSQHGSFPGAIGFISADDPALKPKFFAMCEEVMARYRDDRRILFWNIWNEPGNNGRQKVSVPLVREMFELAWRIGVTQPCAADLWTGSAEVDPDTAEGVAAALSDIVSFHSYSPLADQRSYARALKDRFGRPLVNTEWLARIGGCDVQDCYPFFAQERIGCTCWGFVAGKYQTYEPWEMMWRRIEQGRGKHFKMTKWFHDLFRPSLRPYDPEEISIIRHVNSQMDSERKGESMRAKIARAFGISGEDMWHGFRRTKFTFKGRQAWIAEPSVPPAEGMPWTWTMHHQDGFVDRTGVPALLKEGFHHVAIDLYDTRMDDAGVLAAADFQHFLADSLGFSRTACLIGLGWGGFMAARYAALRPESVCRMYLDNPLLVFPGNTQPPGGEGPWKPLDGCGWADDPRMPVNMARNVAEAGIPVLLVFGTADNVVDPGANARAFADRLEKAGGRVEVVSRKDYGHHPYGFDVAETFAVKDFFMRK